jgi:hypothetical protein
MGVDVDEKFAKKRHIRGRRGDDLLRPVTTLTGVYKCAMDPSDHEDIVWLHTQVRPSPAAVRAYE